MPDDPRQSPATVAPALRCRRRSGALGFVSLLMDVSSEMIHSLLPLFMAGTLGFVGVQHRADRRHGRSHALVVKVFSGALSDHRGRRKGLALCGYALGALSSPLFALATGPRCWWRHAWSTASAKGICGAPRRTGKPTSRRPAARRGVRAAPVAGLGGRLRWPAAGRRADAAVGRRLPRRVLGGGAAGSAVGGAAGLRRASSRSRPPGAAATRSSAPTCGVWAARSGGWWPWARCSLARFSEALRAGSAAAGVARWRFGVAGDGGLRNAVYAFCLPVRPSGRLRMPHRTLLAAGLLVLVASDAALALAQPQQWPPLAAGGLVGLHMGLT